MGRNRKHQAGCPCCGGDPTATCVLYFGAMDRCCAGGESVLAGATIRITGPGGYDHTRTSAAGTYAEFPVVQDGATYTATVTATGRITRVKSFTVSCFQNRAYAFANLWPLKVQLRVRVLNPRCAGAEGHAGECGNPDPIPDGLAGSLVTVTGVSGGTRTATTDADGYADLEFDAPISGTATVTATLPAGRRGWVPVPVVMPIGSDDPSQPCGDWIWGASNTTSTATQCQGDVTLGWELASGYFCDCCIDPLPETLPYSDANGSTDLHRVDYATYIGGVLVSVHGWLGCVTAAGKPTATFAPVPSPGCWDETTGSVDYFVFYSCLAMKRLVQTVTPNCGGTLKPTRPYSIAACTAAEYAALWAASGSGLSLWEASERDCSDACAPGAFSIGFDRFVGNCYDPGEPDGRDPSCGHFAWLQGPGVLTE